MLPEVKTSILDLARQSKSHREISEALGVPRSTVGNIIRADRSKPASPQTSSPTPELEISEKAAADFLKEVGPVPADVPVPPKAAEAKLEAVLKKVVPPRKPKPAKAPEKEAEDPEERAALISRIVMNVETFGPLLTEHLKPNKDAFLTSLHKRGTADLQTQLAVLERSRTVANAANQMRHLLYMGASGVELAASKVGLKASGYAQAVRAQDEEIRMCLREIAMERAESFTRIQRPEVRLAMVFATTLLAVDSSNRMKELAPPAPLPADAAVKFADL